MIVNDSFFDVEDMVYEIIESEYYDDFYIIGHHEGIKQAIKELLIETDLMPHFIELSDPTWDGYDGEFLLSHVEDDIFCEKIKKDGKYLNFDTNVIFLLPDCSDECVENIKKMNPHSVIFKVDFLTGDSEDTDDDGTFYTSLEDVDGGKRRTSIYVDSDKHCFSKSWQDEKNGIHNSSTFSFYSDNLEEAKRIAKIFNIDIG